MKSIIFVAAVFFINFAYAQNIDKQIKNIRIHYKEVSQLINGDISEHNKIYNGNFYCNEIIINKHNDSWSAVGLYNKTIKFWYNDDPYNAEYGQNLKTKGCLDVLLKIEIDIKSVYNWHYEYLFKKGKLVFCYAKYNYHEQDKQEYRFYYTHEKLIKYLEKIEDPQAKRQYVRSDAKSVLEESKKLQDLFLKSF